MDVCYWGIKSWYCAVITLFLIPLSFIIFLVITIINAFYLVTLIKKDFGEKLFDSFKKKSDPSVKTETIPVKQNIFVEKTDDTLPKDSVYDYNFNQGGVNNEIKPIIEEKKENYQDIQN
jgi:hypothetical protein